MLCRQRELRAIAHWLGIAQSQGFYGRGVYYGLTVHQPAPEAEHVIPSPCGVSHAGFPDQ